MTVLALTGCAGDSKPSPGRGIQEGTLLHTADGPVQGATAGGARHFLGIPYAAPPLGALRWKPPMPVAPWTDTRSALDWGGRCAQVGSAPSQSEDCLYLNVWTPESTPAAPLPVLVWFHGGGNTEGSASDDVPQLLGGGGKFYDGTLLSSREGVVVVSVNYRLGPFGFFASKELTAESPDQTSGNQGLLDQQAALQWVRRNILPFGGDSGNVTIFGESAGSWDVCFQQVLPGSVGLFHKAIGESGGCTTFVRTRRTAEAEASAFANAVGCSTGDVLSCLRDKSVAELLIEAPVIGAQVGAPGGIYYEGGTPEWAFGEGPAWPQVRFGAVVDGVVLPEQPRALFDSGKFAKVPVLTGSNADEGTILHFGQPPVTTELEYLDALGRRFGADAGAIAAVYPASAFPTANDALIRVTGDSLLVCPTADVARRVAAAGVDVYMYEFSRAEPHFTALNLGAGHMVELPYVFGMRAEASTDAGPDMGLLDVALSEMVQGYWARFAATGNPNGGGDPAWPTWDSDTDSRIDLDLAPTVVSRFRATECAFWETEYRTEFP